MQQISTEMKPHNTFMCFQTYLVTKLENFTQNSKKLILLLTMVFNNERGINRSLTSGSSPHHYLEVLSCLASFLLELPSLLTMLHAYKLPFQPGYIFIDKLA